MDRSNGRGLPGGGEPGIGLDTPRSVALFDVIVQKDTNQTKARLQG